MECNWCGAVHELDQFWRQVDPLPAVRILEPEPAPSRDAEAGAVDAESSALLRGFAADLRARACTQKTVASMLSTLRTFTAWLPVPLLEATREHVTEWLATPDWAALTRRTYRTTLTSFFAWLVDTGRLSASPAPRGRGVRVPYREPDPLTTEQVQQLLDSGIYARTRLMVLLAAYQGMRVSEIAAAHTDDIELEAGTIRIPNGKGGTDLRRPLHSLVAATIDAMRPAPGYLFPGMQGREHVTGHSVTSTLSTAMRRAGIQGHRPHQLRAWHATELVRLGTDTVTIQHSMRHATLAALHKYIRPDAADIAGAIEQLPIVTVPSRARQT